MTNPTNVEGAGEWQARAEVAERERDAIQHQEINAARREFNGMRRRAEDAEVERDEAERKLAMAVEALEAIARGETSNYNWLHAKQSLAAINLPTGQAGATQSSQQEGEG